MRVILAIILSAVLSLAAFAQPAAEKPIEKPKVEPKKEAVKNPQVLMRTSMGDILIEVFEKETPIHAKNFLKRVDEGKYDSIIFHRVVPNFVIQGGDPTGTGYGQPDEGRLADEKSPYSNTRAYISMARSAAGASPSQFFINLKDNSFLDKQNFSVFAKVIEGMDVVEKISQVPIEPPRDGKPKTPVYMIKVSRKE